MDDNTKDTSNISVYHFSILSKVKIEAGTKRFARTVLTDLQKRFKALEAVGFSPVHGTFSAAVLNSKEFPSPKRISQATINKAEIRIKNVYDIKNLLATGAFEESGRHGVESLFYWLVENAPGKENAYLPGFLREQLAPIAKHINDALLLADMETLSTGKKKKNIAVYEDAVRSFNDPQFAVFVKVEAPIRMYKPDGDYTSSWSYTRGLYGFGPDYESAIRCAYTIISTMRAERLI